MNNRIDKKFAELKERGKKAFIPFIMAGDPSLDITEKLIFELEKQGADIIELGVPFSDPLADGPTIQKSSERALKNKINIDSVCDLVKKVRSKTNVPIVFLIYYNLINNYGVEKFVLAAKMSGVDGVVVPDLPPEESKDLRDAAEGKCFSVVHLASPTSTEERLRKIASSTSGFIYYVSLTGTTGARTELPADISKSLKKIKRITDIPVCVGFGISTPEQVEAVSKAADGVIVGSAIIKIVEENIGNKDMVEKVGGFAGKINVL
jgi:tryptophan synthase alpha chain